MKEEQYGSKIHKVLNQTIFRKLTMKEYMSVVDNIQGLLESARESEKKRMIEVVESIRKLSK